MADGVEREAVSAPLTLAERAALKVAVITRFLGYRQGQYNLRVIEGLLAKHGGDVRQALAASRRRGEHEIMSEGWRLGNFSWCGPGCEWVECKGSCPSTPICVWRPGNNPLRQQQPDVVVTWREVFEYVARRQQPGLFEWAEQAGQATGAVA